MAGDYAVKVPTCDGLRISAHRPRIRLNSSEIFSRIDQIRKDTRCIHYQCIRHTAVDRCVGV
jgi:hypothetical protein